MHGDRHFGDDHAIVGGSNYGQGSSREHAAIAPRYLGLRVVIAKGYARIHWQNLVNFGVLPLTFTKKGDLKKLKQDDKLSFKGLHSALKDGNKIEASIKGGKTITLEHALSPRQVEMLIAGGIINWKRERQ